MFIELKPFSRIAELQINSGKHLIIMYTLHMFQYFQTFSKKILKTFDQRENDLNLGIIYVSSYVANNVSEDSMILIYPQFLSQETLTILTNRRHLSKFGSTVL